MRWPSFVLLFALVFPSVGRAQAHNEAADFEAFFASDFNYCDAKVLAAAWSTDVSNAKTALGWKLRSGNGALAMSAMEDARRAAGTNGVTCQPFEAGYTYEDAVAVSQAWNISVREAKAAIGRKLVYGWTDSLPISGPNSQYGGEGDESGVANDHLAGTMRAFFDSSYTVCDARMVAQAWGQDLSSAKSTIGYKVTSGYTGQLQSVLEGERQLQRVRCSFHDDFSYEDSVTLARVWGIDQQQAKVRAEGKLMRGNAEGIRAALRTGK